MNTLVLYFILANLGLAAFYLFFRLLLQKDTFFAGKRVALLVGILLALTYPLLDLSSWIQRSDSLVEYAGVLRSRLPEIPVDAVTPTSEALPTFADVATQTGVTSQVDCSNLSDTAQFTSESAVSITLEGQTEQGIETEQGLGPALQTSNPASVNAATTPKNQSTKKASIFSYFTVFDYLLLIYLLTTAFLLFRIVRQLLRILHCRRKAERIKVHDQWVYVLKGCLSPFSFFGFIFMDPDAYSDKNLLEIIVHERAHIKQGHSYDVVFSELMCALFWINPFAWLLKRSLRENLEFLADRDVIKKGVDPKTYQYKLLQLSCHRSDANLANHFNVSQLKKRIVMMNKKRTSWEGLGKYALSLPLFAALLLTAYAWGQQHETEAKEMVANVTADSKVIAALTVDPTTLLAQNTPNKTAQEQPTVTTQRSATQTAFSVDDILYRNLNEKNAEVVYGKSKTGKLVIPSTVKINGVTYTVTSIGQRAFYNDAALRSITLPSTLYNIMEQAFSGCSGLTSLNLPSSVAIIAREAFSGCERLSSITLPSSLRSLGNKVFYDCTGLKQLTVDENNKAFCAIDGVIFSKNRETLMYYPYNKAKHYTIPSSVRSIGSNAFTNCTGLTSVTIPSSVTSIRENAFFCCSGLTSITLPSSLETIEGGAFRYCSGLTSITIPSSVTKIETNAFSECIGLTSVSIPATTVLIGNDVFYGCFNLKQFHMDPNNPNYTSFEGAMVMVENNYRSIPKISVSSSSSSNKVLPSTSNVASPSFFTVDGINYLANSANTVEVTSGGTYKGDVVIPAKVDYKGVTYQVTKIGGQAFANCPELTSLSLPASIKTMISSSFYRCPLLSRINVDDMNPNFTSVDGVVYDKNKTTLVIYRGNGPYVIPSTVTKIGNGAFYGCTGLTSVVIPSNVTIIEDAAFFNCSGLTSLVISSSVNSIGRSAFSGCTGLTSLVIPSSVTSIGDRAFENCTGLTTLSFPSSVTSIGNSVFMNCTNLTSVTLPEKVSTIGDGIFMGCIALKQIDVDSKNPYYSSMDGVLFNKDKTALIAFPINKSTQYVVPSTVKSIGAYAFQSCRGLTAVTFPSSVVSIGDFAFERCASLKELDLPTSLTTIGKSAFTGCTGLQTLNLPASLTTIGARAFGGCRALKSLILPASVLMIDNDAFRDCAELKTITIPASLIKLGTNAFYDCSKLEAYTVDKNNAYYSSLDGVLFNKEKTQLIDCPKGKSSPFAIPSGVTSIGETAFGRCQSLPSLTIPSSITKIGDNAFSGCMRLASVSMPSTITSIGYLAFASCVSLSSITIPSSVSFVGENVFQFCRGLKEIHCKARNPLVISDIFGLLVDKKTCKLYVPKGSSELYAQAKVWGEFATIIEE